MTAEEPGVRSRIRVTRTEPAAAQPGVPLTSEAPVAAQQADLPPWFAAFALASDTRFTRTPDHVLRRRLRGPNELDLASDEPMRHGRAPYHAPPRPDDCDRAVQHAAERSKSQPEVDGVEDPYVPSTIQQAPVHYGDMDSR